MILLICSNKTERQNHVEYDKPSRQLFLLKIKWARKCSDYPHFLQILITYGSWRRALENVPDMFSAPVFFMFVVTRVCIFDYFNNTASGHLEIRTATFCYTNDARSTLSNISLDCVFSQVQHPNIQEFPWIIVYSFECGVAWTGPAKEFWLTQESMNGEQMNVINRLTKRGRTLSTWPAELRNARPTIGNIHGESSTTSNSPIDSFWQMVTVKVKVQNQTCSANHYIVCSCCIFSAICELKPVN